MSIEEKQRALEFTFVPDNIDGDLKYDITYDESNPVFSLQISTGGNRIDYPLDLFVEIVEFLTNKGVIRKPAYTKTIVTPGAERATVNAHLLPPKIEKSGEAISPPLSSNIDPLASFDITNQSGSIPTPAIVKKTEGSIPTPEIIKTNISSTGLTAPTITTAPTDSTEETAPIAPSSEMISRPVIRSRVTGGDPQSAEKEAAMLRASSGKGNGRTIRKAHRAEDE